MWCLQMTPRKGIIEGFVNMLGAIRETFVRLLTRWRSGSQERLGIWGERLAADYLKRCGFQVVLTNFTAPIGQRRDGRLVTGEIDIVAYDVSTLPPTLVFIEVKTRTRGNVATPEAAVGRRKQRQIVRVARVYRRLFRVADEPYRYDVLSIMAGPSGEGECSLLRGYFTERILSSEYRLSRV